MGIFPCCTDSESSWNPWMPFSTAEIMPGRPENIRDWLEENARPGDLVITVGSGNVYSQTRKLL